MVAKDYLNNYIGYIRSDGNWPTTREIEEGYDAALDRNGLPPPVAIDGIFTAVGIDSWECLGMEDERFEESDIFDDIPFDYAMSYLVQIINGVRAQWLEELPNLFDSFAQAYKSWSLKNDYQLEQFMNGIVATYRTFFASFIRRDPLILDLDRDGVETIPEAGFNSVKFDYEGYGIKTPTGWVGTDDGLLVLDRNGNGTIDNGSELFSDYTPMGDGTLARNGVEALRTVDSNADGIINASDAQFSDLRVWRDLDQDGVSDAGEQFTLSELGITAINARDPQAGPGDQPNGNSIEQIITYSKSDGITGQIGEVWFRESALATEFTDEVVLTPEAQALPQVQGLGMVRDLRACVLGRRALSAPDTMASRFSLHHTISGYPNYNAP